MKLEKNKLFKKKNYEIKDFQLKRLIDWLFTVLRSAQEYFTYMETSPMPVKGCKIWAYARRSGPLSREGFLLCHTCCGTGPRFFRSHPKDRPIQSPLTTHKGMWRIYSNPDPHGPPISRLLRHTRGCGGPIQTRILTGFDSREEKQKSNWNDFSSRTVD
jgi:hypothetical protein